MAQAQGFRRKNYFIKKKFQASFFVKFFALLVIEALLIAGLFMYIAKGTLTTGYQGPEFVIEKTASFFFISFILISLIVGIAIGISGILVFVYVSHRIAGPLFRFEKSLEEVASGNLSHRIKLRKTDQLTELQESLNRLIERVDSDIQDIKQDVSRAQKIIKENPSNVEALKEAIENLKKKLEAFKTSA